MSDYRTYVAQTITTGQVLVHQGLHLPKKGAISSITERVQFPWLLNFYCHGGFCMALVTIAANPLTYISAWCHNSKVRTGGWLIPWYRRSHSASLSVNHLLSNGRQSVTESRVELKNPVTQSSPRYHLFKVGSIF